MDLPFVRNSLHYRSAPVLKWIQNVPPNRTCVFTWAQTFITLLFISSLTGILIPIIFTLRAQAIYFPVYSMNIFFIDSLRNRRINLGKNVRLNCRKYQRVDFFSIMHAFYLISNLQCILCKFS